MGNPIFSDEIEPDGWTHESLGTLGLVVYYIHPDSKKTIQAIITAAHNCHRNFEVVYGFIYGRGTSEEAFGNPAPDLVVSMLPNGLTYSSDTNSVDGKYANSKVESTAITGCISKISASPPGVGTQIFFRGAVNKAVGEYISNVKYKKMECYLCRFFAGDHGDSGACVFYKSNSNEDEYIAFGIMTAKINSGHRNDHYVVTPLSVIANSKNPAISLAGVPPMQVYVLPHTTTC